MCSQRFWLHNFFYLPHLTPVDDLGTPEAGPRVAGLFWTLIGCGSGITAVAVYNLVRKTCSA